MSDLRTDLERLGERAAPKTDAFERLERRRRRRERNRRIGAGVLALVLVVGGSLAAYTAFRDTEGGRTIGGDTGQDQTLPIDEGFHALWPEWTLEEAQAAQAQVQQGEAVWRGNPYEVATRFAASVLGWNDPRLGETEARLTDVQDPSGDSAVFVLRLCPADGSCDPLTARVLVTVREVLPGLWSVIQVEGNGLHSPLAVGAQVPDRSEMRFDVVAPDGARIPISLWYGDARCAAGVGEELIVNGGVGSYELSLDDVVCNGEDEFPGLQEPTDGLIWIALMEPSSATPYSLFEVEPGGMPDVGYIVDLAAVPVRFVPSGTTSTGGNVAEFTCDGTGTISPSSAVVAAQSDGVHIAVTATGDLPVSFSIEGVGGDGADAGERVETVWQLAPGPVTVSCSVESAEFGGVASSSSLTVVDPGGYYVAAELDCASVVGQIPEYGEGATGSAGDPVQVVRDHLSGLEFDDAVERASYPQSEQPVVRVVRDGGVVAKVVLRDDGQGGWLLDTLENCDGTLFGWSEEITGVTGPPADPGVVCLDLGLEPPSNEVNVHQGSDLHIDGKDLGFDANCLGAPAGEPLTISFSNLDAGVPRNLSVYAMAPCLMEAVSEEAAPRCPPETLELPYFQGEIVSGVGEIVYELGPLEPGTYYFQDDIHPAANGALIVS
jgi:hypothetical protein